MVDVLNRDVRRLLAEKRVRDGIRAAIDGTEGVGDVARRSGAGDIRVRRQDGTEYVVSINHDKEIHIREVHST